MIYTENNDINAPLELLGQYKIVKLKFYDTQVPFIGMMLKDSDNRIYEISGIVFESGSDGMWDCKIEDNLNELSSKTNALIY